MKQNIKNKIAANGWDLPAVPVPVHPEYDILHIAKTFEELDSFLSINSTAGYRRRTEAIGQRPKKGESIIDPPTGIITSWNADAIQAACSQHYIGTFSNSAYLCEAMMGDARIAHALNSHTKSITKRDPIFTPNPRAKDQKLAKYIADELQELYYDIIPLEIQDQLWSWTTMMGYSVFNMTWDNGLENLYLPELRFWHPAYTFFLMSSDIENRKLQAITQGQGSIPIEIGDPQWFHFAPYGEYRGWIRGTVRQIAIPWLVRNYSLRDWSRLSEVHGLPQRIVKVPANGLAEDKARIFSKLINLASEATFILPVASDGTGFSVELLEAKNSNAWEIFSQLAARCDSDIMLAIKGTQLSSALGDQKGGSSSHAAEKGVRDEDDDYADSQAKKFAATARQQIFRKIVEYNHADAADCVPLFDLSNEPEEDKANKAQVYVNVSNALLNFDSMGIELDLDKVEQDFGIPFKKVNEVQEQALVSDSGSVFGPENILLGKINPEEETVMSRKKDTHKQYQQFIDNTIDIATKHGNNSMGKFITKVQKAIDEAKTPEELRRKLKQLARSIKHGSMEQVLKSSTLVAELAGIAAAQEAKK
jgi:phage gp29-like protein